MAVCVCFVVRCALVVSDTLFISLIECQGFQRKQRGRGRRTFLRGFATIATAWEMHQLCFWRHHFYLGQIPQYYPKKLQKVRQENAEGRRDKFY